MTGFATFFNQFPEVERLRALIPVVIVGALALVLWRWLSPTSRAQRLFADRQPVTRLDVQIACGAAIAFYFLALWRLDLPAQAIFDECYHGRSGMEYLLGKNPTEWTHPPLGKLLIASSLKLWGGAFDPTEGVYKPDGPFTSQSVIGWRYASVVAASLSLPLLYALTRIVTGRRRAAILAIALLATDGIFFVQARMAMTNAFTVCFVLLASLAAVQRVRSGQWRWWPVLGIGLGLALATRWSTLFVVALLGLFLLAAELGRLVRKRSSLGDWLGTAGGMLLAFLAIPLGLYLLSYVPYMRQGHDLVKVFSEQGAMWNYHTQLKEGHGYASPWWSWPLMLRPTWYHFSTLPGDTRRIGVCAIGNPFLWWAFLPALGMSAYLAVRERRSELGFLALMGLGQWLLWGVQERPLIFTHYLLEAIPFAAAALGLFLDRLWEPDTDESEESREGRRLALSTYGFLILLWFLAFYPILSAYPISPRFYDWHIWLGRLWT